MNYPLHTLLSRTGHAQQNYLRPYLSQLGLSPGQPKVLRCLYSEGVLSQRALADYCEVDPAAICRTLDILERNGFIVRRPSRTDRRTGEVSLTEKGVATFEAWEDQCSTIEARMLQGFTGEEKEHFADYLSRAYRNMGGRLL
ncbi:MAG TPA: MarR family transcriptional regulator [Candidatus Blautia faecigallinarum]|uniref:MarR family transcriptional regulator n=1 Tax=Candidatus Blautia faecigallinarum TaxID=2838488 RepID=A0A9D2ISR5_9FIRM|nr:MarR family transcriptional regulator [Candidatus Blautia faecigallinarum]